MTDKKNKIAVYEIDDLWAVNVIIKALKKNYYAHDNLDIVSISPKQIAEDVLLQDDYIGFVMPGRNRGKDYIRELGDVGSSALYHASHDKGVSMLKICAGSYYTSRLIEFENILAPGDVIVETNPLPHFHGRAVGAFNGLLANSYVSAIRESADYNEPLLGAEVANIRYSSLLTGQSDAINGHSLYWGGGAFIPDAGAHPDLVTLASHRGIIDIGRQSLIDPAAVIEFRNGPKGGKIILSNIHPELSGQLFGHIFATTPKAQKQKETFIRDCKKLVASDTLNTLILGRFIQNCLDTLPSTHANQVNSVFNKQVLC